LHVFFPQSQVDPGRLPPLLVVVTGKGPQPGGLPCRPGINCAATVAQSQADTSRLPLLLVVVTGKGPQRADYLTGNLEIFCLPRAAGTIRATPFPQSQADPGRLPPLLVVVTGKGPQRAGYLARLARLDLRRCAFRTAWLQPGDYPRLLGAADLGVCLHTSSSGLDLPMKVLKLRRRFGDITPTALLHIGCSVYELRASSSRLDSHEGADPSRDLPGFRVSESSCPAVSPVYY